MVFFLNVPQACVLLLLTWLGQDVLATTTAMAGTHRVLRAATRRGEMYKRNMRITKRFEAEVGYVEGTLSLQTGFGRVKLTRVEENGWSGVSTFASQVKVGSQKPILNLEEVEHHLQDVRCGDGKMEVSFVDKVSARDTYHACHESDGGLVITSHDSCNVEGERAVYKYDRTTSIVTLVLIFSGYMMYPLQTTEKRSSSTSLRLHGKTRSTSSTSPLVTQSMTTCSAGTPTSQRSASDSLSTLRFPLIRPILSLLAPST
jgi:hypothetical protein